MTAIRAVCFDLDGTLLRDDRVDEVVRAVAAALAERYGLADPDALADANERHWVEYWPEVGAAWLAGTVPPDSVPTEVWRRALADEGVMDAAAPDFAVALHAELEAESFELYEESLEVLDAMRAGGIRTALITNGPSTLQRAKLRATGIETAFDVVIVSGEHGMNKPEHGIFALALERLGVQAAAALHVGDNLDADVRGARDAGLLPVWIDRGILQVDADTRPDAVVTGLRGLYDFVGIGSGDPASAAGEGAASRPN
jgi:putative hydrolase of the HAD superfamily